jgi:carboxylesterase type B
MRLRTKTPAPAQVASGAPVVYVSINYRLGAFGFLGSTSLMAAGKDGGTGNWGTQVPLDIRLSHTISHFTRL